MKASDPVASLSDVVSRIFFVAREEGVAVKPMKLQKLLFFAYGWYAGVVGKKLFAEEFEAWPYGPVLPHLYRRYRKYGAKEIFEEGAEKDLGEEANIIVDGVVENYGDSTDMGLSDLTHEPRGPWDTAWRKSNGDEKRQRIPFETVKQYYGKLQQEALKEAGYRGKK